MIHRVFSIYDAKACAFNQPFFSANQNTATRAVMSSMGPESQLVKFPEDFVLMEIGAFDDEKGVLVGVELPKIVVNIAALREREHAKDA